MEPHVSIQWNRIDLVNLLLPDVCTITGYMNVGVLVVFNELTFPGNNFISTSFLFDIDKRYWEMLAHSKGSWWYPVKIAGSADHTRKFWTWNKKFSPSYRKHMDSLSVGLLELHVMEMDRYGDRYDVLVCWCDWYDVMYWYAERHDNLFNVKGTRTCKVTTAGHNCLVRNNNLQAIILKYFVLLPLLLSIHPPLAPPLPHISHPFLVFF